MLKQTWRRLLAGAMVCACACVPRAEAVSPRQLLEVADIGRPVMSPDGRSVAFRVERASVERNTWDSVWYVQGLDEAAPRRVGEGGVPLRDSAGVSLPVAALWSPDGRWIYYRALLDGRVDVWRAAANGSKAEPVTRDEADVRDFSLAGDGRSIRYSVGATREAVLAAEQEDYERGTHIDGTVPIGQGLFRSGNVEGRLATQRFGSIWFSRMPLLGETPDRWYEIDLATGAKRALAAAEVKGPPPTAPGLPEMEGDPWQHARNAGGQWVAILTRVGDGTGQLERPDVLLSVLPAGDAAGAVHCRAELCTARAISGIQWRPMHDEVVFTVTDPAEGLAQSMYRWNVRDGGVFEVVRAQGLLGGGRDPSSRCGISPAHLVCVAAEADRPPRLERIDLENGTRHVLFEPNEALAKDLALEAPARLLRWADAQGRRFTGQFYAARHVGGTPPPLFVTYYSCPGFVRGGVGDEWPLASLAQAGISALCINRLPGYTMDAVERHGEGMAAVESVVDMLAAEGEIDRARVGMGGLSFGGAVTLWTVTGSDVLAAASVANPVVSPLYYLIGSMKGEMFFGSLRDMWGLGDPEETPERWREISPALKLDRVRAPVLFQLPEQEYMYALDYVIPLMRTHRADVYVFSHEPHQKFQPRHKLAAYERNVDWFRFWLQGYEDAAASKQAQYARWREMRADSGKSAADEP